MLEMRPDCESCGRDLLPDAGALICSFECTWCPDCAGSQCRNCGGALAPRPTRAADLLAKNPASTERKFRG
ncbi:DUF1272 domain-containing protein [Sphingomonas paeninsulae]|uniref:DUF1272 domain-containing protein n=1 Tax=Sphingomonas paeninsulae TaxID=2319844 RepID=A0A494T8X4_SPHPE|nr:DUF1272 domain-containing protein [Sphingomonas paeninsulae]AYJ85797.1 DUF1272 domain-containing protein [Sphingomonas paeninsulae]